MNQVLQLALQHKIERTKEYLEALDLNDEENKLQNTKQITKMGVLIERFIKDANIRSLHFFVV